MRKKVGEYTRLFGSPIKKETRSPSFKIWKYYSSLYISFLK